MPCRHTAACWSYPADTALHVCAQRNALRVPRRLGVAMGADAVICPAGIQHTYRMRRSYPAVTALHVCANPNALRVPRRLGETQRCGAAMGADASMRRGCPPTPPSCPVAHCPGRSCSIRALLTQPRCGRRSSSACPFKLMLGGFSTGVHGHN
jgi:hypothetical protein